MSALRILLVEDNPITALNLEEQLFDFGYEVVGKAADPEEAMELFTAEKPDLAILDIHLGDREEGGLEVGYQINKLNPIPVILLTSHADLQTRLKARAIDPANYLVKPWTPQQLDVAIDMAMHQYYARRQGSSQGEPPIFHSFSPIGREDAFFVRHKDRYVKVRIADIAFVKGAGDAGIQIFSDPQVYTFSTGIGSFLEQVNHPALLRVHRSFIVNIDRVHAYKDDFLFLFFRREQRSIPISDKYRASLLQVLTRLRSDGKNFPGE